MAGSHLVATTPRLLFTAARGAILTPWSIAGQWLVYMQYPANDPAGSWTLAVRNLRTGRSTILDTPTQEGVPSLAAQAASDGRTVVWQSWTVHHGQTTSVIRAYDLVTGHRRLLIEGGGMTMWSYAWLDVSGRWVVFEKETPDRQSPHGQILLDNLDTGRVQALTPAAAANSEPAISGDLVIWKNTWRFAAGHGVGVYNVRTGAQVTLAGANVEQPKVTFGRYVVFPTGNPFHVQLYDVQTHVSTTLAGPRPDGYQPGNVVLVGGHAVAFILAKFTTTTKPFPTRLVVTQLP